MLRAVKYRVVLGMAFLTCHAHTHAQVDFNGFASMAAGQTLSNGKSTFGTDNTFTVDVPNQGKYHDSLSFKEESIFGLQASSDLADGLTVTGQITAAGADNFDAKITWAYAKYRMTDSSYILLGRQRLPLFYYSDFIDVGYAYHWMRPPVEATGGVINEFNGLLINKEYDINDWTASFSAYFGNADEDLARFGNTEVDDLWGIVFNASYDWLQLRAAYSGQKIALVDGQFSTGGKAHDEENPLDVSIWGAAAFADFNDFFLMAEYTSSNFGEYIAVDQFVGQDGSVGWYLSGGIRQDKLTYHLTYHTASLEIDAGVGTTAQAAFGLPFAPFTSDQDIGTKAWTFGVRWDFHPSAAFKVEYTDKEDDNDDGYRNFFGSQSTVSVFSAGVDLVF